MDGSDERPTILRTFYLGWKELKNMLSRSRIFERGHRNRWLEASPDKLQVGFMTWQL